MKQSDMDSSFEKYRRDRTFRRLQSAGDKRGDGRSSSVLQQLEAAERSELRSETLSREVHEFFADATRTAAGIVQNISENHEQEADRKIRRDIEDFLQDVIRRAEVFMTVLHANREPGAQQTEVETTLRNILGPRLDGFRAEGTARLGDKHLGQDPFGTPIELRGDAESGEEADGEPEAPESGSSALRQPEPIPGDDQPAAEGWVETDPIDPMQPPAKVDKAPQPAPRAAAKPAPRTPPEAAAMLPGLPSDPEKLRTTLKALVLNGVLDREQAQAMYRAMMTRR